MTETNEAVITELARRYGTPLFVYDADVLAEQYLHLRARLDESVEILYSLKANPNIAVCQVLHRLGAGAEVSSLVELITARRAGVQPDDIIFLGPGKSRDELAACVRGEAGLLVAESYAELDHYEDLARTTGARPQVALRVNPGFSVKGAGLAMGGKPRQFGMDEASLLRSGPVSERWPSLDVVGVHAYMGTRILDEASIAANTRQILEMAERITAHLGCPLDVVDIGGGLGVAYFDGEGDLDADVLGKQVNLAVRDFRERHPHTRLLMELGRYLTAPAGNYVVRVRYVKESVGQMFAVADGGTNHHMAAVGTGSIVKRNFPVRLVGGGAVTDGRPWCVSGPLCTPNDLLVKNAVLPELSPGDLIAIGRSGAYGPSASPVLFLGHGHPAEVMVRGSDSWLVRERDTAEELISKQRPIETGEWRDGFGPY